MKLLSFSRQGKSSFGVKKDNGIIDLGSRSVTKVSCLLGALQTGLIPSEDELDELAPDYSFSDVILLPVIPNPSKILCVGLNYEKHRQETKREKAGYPTIFTRFADTQVGHGQNIIKPAESERLDFEGELAVIIGKGGRHIEQKNVMEHIAGYSCYNDASVRDWQRHTSQFTPGKNFPKTGAFGPWMATSSEIKNYKELSITTRLNKNTVQEASLDQLIFDIPTIVSYCSKFTCLSVGDVIVTGTPGGVGDRREPPLYMKHGDIIEVEISQIGVLRNNVMDSEAF